MRSPSLIVPGQLAAAFVWASPALSGYPAAKALAIPPAVLFGDSEALELKLQGMWSGPDCAGEFIFRADGTYERLHVGPGGINSAGTWQLRWDALRPILTLSCKTSTDPGDAGRTLEVKVLQLNDGTFAFDYPGSGTWRYSRVPR